MRATWQSIAYAVFMTAGLVAAAGLMVVSAQTTILPNPVRNYTIYEFAVEDQKMCVYVFAGQSGVSIYAPEAVLSVKIACPELVAK